MATELSNERKFVDILAQESTLIGLAPEVLLHILSYCSNDGLSQLLLTCKAAYTIVYPVLWSSLSLGFLDPDFSPYAFNDSLHLEQMDDLARITHALVGSDLGYGFITKIAAFLGREESLELVGGPETESPFLEVLGERLKGGKVSKLKYLELELCRKYLFEMHDESRQNKRSQFGNLISEVNRYSKGKLQNQVSLDLKYECSSIKGISADFDYSKLTKLDLRFKNPIAEGPVHDIMGPAKWARDYTNYSNQARDITALTKLLSTATNLRELTLEPKSARPYHRDVITMSPLPASVELLQKLQIAISRLGRLKTFHVSDFLFDPSFFPTPPTSVTTVMYTKVERVSRSWWRQFASYDFPNVDSMTIHYQHELALGSSRREWWRGIDDDLTQEADGGYDGFQHWKFKINNVVVTGLKEFICEDRRDYFLPTDLVECIVRNNQGIQEKWREPMAAHYEISLSVECQARLMKPISDQGFTEVNEIVRKRFLERHRDGENKPDEEQEIRLYTIEYAKEMVKWLEENMESKATGN
ncbi:hypothetical protein TWF481_007820 [Arthrobotrys musiformis]|uniref:F-box domain-containing protein n=1 Tax=Arthrobotrys musiformis TaxID=47236 RepID=A0AAV9W5B6_9PEZI